MSKYVTKINYANPRYNSLRCGIPKEIVELLNLSAGDNLKWILDEDTGKVSVEKLEL